MKPRAYTQEEVRDKVLSHIRAMVGYWAKIPLKATDIRGDETLWRCDGVAFSILAMLDGSTLATPAFDLVACPHPEDKQYHIEEGENWFEPETRLSYPLHEYYSSKENQATPPLEPVGIPMVISRPDGTVEKFIADGREFTPEEVRHALTLFGRVGRPLPSV